MRESFFRVRIREAKSLQVCKDLIKCLILLAVWPYIAL
jgi:hypothetical protein